MKPKVVVCGSFHKQSNRLALLIEELEQTGCQILSPFTTSFINNDEPFVRGKHDEGFSDFEIERFHLRAIKQCDFIWLHAPNGYVGISGSFELGFAYAHNKTIFSFEEPNDAYLASIVRKTPSVFSSLRLFSSSNSEDI